MTTSTAQSVPKGWNRVRLGDIGKVSMCKRVFREETSPVGEVPFYKIGTFGKEPDAYISKELFDSYREKFSFPKDGDVLLSASGTIGRKVKYDGRPAYFQDSNIIWLEHDECKILNSFLFYLYDTLTWQTEGSTIKRLYNSILLKKIVGLPPLSEQQKIAEILSTIDKEIQKTDEIIATTEKLKRGLMQQLLFGGIKKTLFSDLVDLRKEIFDPKTEDSEKYIGLEHIDQNSGTILGFGDSRNTESLKTKFYVGDVLFGKLRPYLRKYWKAKFEGVCTTEIFVFEPKRKQDVDFIFYLVQSDQFIANSHSKSFGTKMPRTNWDIVSSFEFEAPDPNRREEIGQVLTSVDEKIAISKKLKERLTLLKNGLMQDLLSGKKRTV